MASEILGLFTSPEMYQQQQDLMMQRQAAELAQLDPYQSIRYGATRAGQQFGRGLAGLLGAEDPQLRMISARQSVLGGLDLSNPEAIFSAARQLSGMRDPQGALALADYARKTQENLARTEASVATAEKARLTMSQEIKLRDELAKLPANASQDDVISVLSKYGSPERVLAALSVAATTRESIEARKDIAAENRAAREQEVKARLEQREAELKDREEQRMRELQVQHENRMEQLRQQNAARADLERERQDYKREVADEKKAREEEKKDAKTLSAGLQVKEDDDLKLIDSYKSQQKALSPVIAALTPDPKTGVRLLELGPLKNRSYEAANLMGRSTVQSRAYENLRSAVDTAVNIQVSAEKGVQTDRDVLRFAQALVGAYGKNDTKATLEALKRFNSAIKDAEVKTRQIIESRRKSQGVKPYFEGEAPTSGGTKRVVKYNEIPQ
jgi:hypothetical protein